MFSYGVMLLVSFILAVLAAQSAPLKTAISIAFFSFLVLALISVLVEVFIQLKPTKSSEDYFHEKFKKFRNEAAATDRQRVSEILEKSKHDKRVLKIVEDKVQFLIEEKQDSAKLHNDNLRIIAIVFVLLSIVICMCYFIPPEILLKTVFSIKIESLLSSVVAIDNIKLLSAVVAVSLAVVGAVIGAVDLILKHIAASDSHFCVSRYKRCLFLIEQAQNMLDNIEVNKNTTQPKGHVYIVRRRANFRRRTNYQGNTHTSKSDC